MDDTFFPDEAGSHLPSRTLSLTGMKTGAARLLQFEKLFRNFAQPESINRAILESLHPKERLRLTLYDEKSSNNEDPIPGFWNTTAWEDDLAAMTFSDRTISDDNMKSLVEHLKKESPTDELTFHCCIFSPRSIEKMRDEISKSNDDIEVSNLVLNSIIIRDEDWQYIAEIVLLCGIELLSVQNSTLSATSLFHFNEGLTERQNYPKMLAIAFVECGLHSEADAKRIDEILSSPYATLIRLNDTFVGRKGDKPTVLFGVDEDDESPTISQEFIAKLHKACKIKEWFANAAYPLLNSPGLFIDRLEGTDYALEQLTINFDSNTEDYTGLAEFISAMKVKSLFFLDATDTDLQILCDFLKGKKHSIESLFCEPLNGSNIHAITRIITECGVRQLKVRDENTKELNCASLCKRGIASFLVPELMVMNLGEKFNNWFAGGIAVDFQPTPPSPSSSTPVTFGYQETKEILELLSVTSLLILYDFSCADDLENNLKAINIREKNPYEVEFFEGDVYIKQRMAVDLKIGGKKAANLESLRAFGTELRYRTSSLRKIDLSHQSLRKEDIDDLQGIMRFCDSLSDILLRECCLTGADVEQIAKGIVDCNKKLSLLDLSYNPDLKEKGARTLASLLRASHVENIHVIGCDLHHLHDTVIAPAMISMPLQVGGTVVYAEDKVDFTINIHGGMVEFVTKRCSISFPPNCVKEPTNVMFKLKDPSPNENIPSGLIPVCPIIQCLPSGTEFDAPVVIRLGTWVRPAENVNDQKLTLTVISRRTEQDEWSAITVVHHASDDYAEFETYHFSDFEVVLDERAAGMVEANYCTLLFLPQMNPTHKEGQMVSSWFVPNDQEAKQTVKAEMSEVGMTLYQGAGSRLQINPTDRLSVSITQFQDPNIEPVVVRPNDPKNCAGADLLRNRMTRVNFVVRLVNNEASNQEKSVDFSLNIAKQTGESVEDPFALTWRPAGEVPIRHVYNTYNTIYYTVNNITNSNVNIAAEDEAPRLTQQLMRCSVGRELQEGDVVAQLEAPEEQQQSASGS